jgi:hypothetical protein
MIIFENIEDTVFNFFNANILYFAIMFAAIIGKIKESAKKNIYTVWIIYLVGTFFHELSHYLSSLFLNGRPNWFSIFPSKSMQADGTVNITLGYVNNQNLRWYNVFFIALAPLSLIPTSYWVYFNFFNFFDKNIFSFLIYIFLIVSLIFSSIPSSTDLKLVFNKYLVVNLIIPILCFIILVNS